MNQVISKISRVIKMEEGKEPGSMFKHLKEIHENQEKRLAEDQKGWWHPFNKSPSMKQQAKQRKRGLA